MTKPHYHHRLHCNYALAIAALLLSFSPKLAFCQVNGDNTSQIYDPALLPLLTQTVYGRLSNLTSTILTSQLTKNAGFCIKDPEVEWDRAFNYSSNLTFLSSCIQKTNGDMSLRLCTAAEAKFYFNRFVVGGSVVLPNNGGGSGVLPNKNCNLTSWVPGCEPGWACSVNPTVEVSLNESEDIPSRTLDCRACCEGFFCPEGLTCMIPCPLGSYCPLATLNETTSFCDPYLYQLPPGQPNHTCGAANIWTDVGRSIEVFCSAGSYCPTSTEEVSCSSGHYCRMGSMYEKGCSKLTSCRANSAYQNIHAYGIMFIVALVTILLITYSCCDQVISTRERRHAKSREAAARSVRQKTQAHERWKSAKNAAMKHVKGFQSQLSRTFSHRKTVTPSEELRMFSQTDFEIDDDLFPTMDALILSSSERSSAAGGKKTEPSDLMGIHGTEEGPDICNDNTLQVEDKNLKRQTPKKKQLHSDSQIFKYAYGQLEIEKAMAQHVTFSGVISMATHLEIKKRPLIEVSFIDLTVTLKGSNKHLLRCVTGKILPGRITAVMGPSGAGKTTFLSAVVGKTVGCKMTGSILINGKKESIRSYRKIIGYVPQDDIVHGNLTVEENLWFSARCRLSANLPKADKVLIVERVIEELGLQAVRESLVGTVEKRGISGGQRKRVNVGLELVMEPSLLILDEPTSGLDSSSSQLLLRALRREALIGVNICLVVHQPSYTLFKMFDDLILLAKGGLTVYHGPVERVEEYFAGLGINVPERVNPPDHFIDVLEDIVKPSTSSGISSKELPLQWMLHNRYVVPPEMQQNSAGLAIHSAGVTLHNQLDSNASFEELSFAGEVWQDIRHNVDLQRDIIRHNFLRSSDFSHRRTPGLLLQYKYFIGRVIKQRLREARILAVDFLILLLAGACLGSLLKFKDATFGAPIYTYSIIAVSLLCTISALRSFSQDKLQYWRESASGISSLAHFLSKDTIDHLNTVIKPAIFLSLFYSFTNPRSSFSDNYVVLLCLVYCVTGIGYALSIFLEPGPSQLCAVLLPVVLTLISTQTGDGALVKNLANFCYPKWALEAFVVANAERYSGVWIITRCGLLKKLGYSLNGWGRSITFLILAGIVTRAIAYVGMLTFQRKR